jgi:hypothetical protein
MSRQAQLEQLLVRWDELREQGRELTAEEGIIISLALRSGYAYP